MYAIRNCIKSWYDIVVCEPVFVAIEVVTVATEVDAAEGEGDVLVAAAAEVAFGERIVEISAVEDPAIEELTVESPVMEDDDAVAAVVEWSVVDDGAVEELVNSTVDVLAEVDPAVETTVEGPAVELLATGCPEVNVIVVVVETVE